MHAGTAAFRSLQPPHGSPALNLGLYRLTLLGGLFAVVVLMFSVVSRPGAFRSEAAPDAFDQDRAAGLARAIVEAAPERQPGSRGDDAAADLVTERFTEIAGGEVTEQGFGGRFEGEDVDLRNITLTLPGTEDSRIVFAASRDCAEGPCAVSSAAATATLLELADTFSGARHDATVSFVSLDGSTAGAAGARELAAGLEIEPADAVIVVAQPGASRPEAPFAVPWSAGVQSTSVQLLESAAAALQAEGGIEDAASFGTAESLLRLAIPSGLGDQAVLIEEGIDSVALTSAGDTPLPVSSDGLDSLSAATIGDIGRAALVLGFALDERSEPLEHGPDTYVPLAGKLIPGWAVALLAAALLLPIGAVALDGSVRHARAGEPLPLAFALALTRAVPFVATLVLAYLLELFGLMPGPAFPFDPQRFSPGAGSVLVLLVLLAAMAGSIRLIGRLAVPAEAEDALSPAIATILFAGLLGIWLANPFFALMLVPAGHLWLLAAQPEMRGRRAAAWSLLAAGAVVPAVALLAVGGQIGAGAEIPWDLLLMFTGRHFGVLVALPLCLLGGCALAIAEAAGSESVPPRPRDGSGIRGPLGYAGPGSLGGTESALPRR